MDHEQREFPRLDILGRLSGEVSVLAPIAVYDISRAGAQVECAFPLLVGSAHEVRLHLADESIVVRARVVHCHIAEVGRELVRYVAGVEFIECPPHVLAALGEYLERIRRERAESGP